MNDHGRGVMRPSHDLWLPQNRLDRKRVGTIREAVEGFAGVDVVKFVRLKALSFYRYSRSEEKDHHLSPLAFCMGGRICVQIPMIDRLPGDCLAFVILHELGHLVGKSSEKDATAYSVELLRNGETLPDERIFEIAKGWRRARRTPSVVKRERELTEMLGDGKLDANNLFEAAVVDLLNSPDWPVKSKL